MNLNLNEYQSLAMRTCSITDNPKDMLNHALLGLASEAGEAAALLQKVYQGHPSPLEDGKARQHLIVELGDCLWMLAEAAQAIGCSLDTVAIRNINKLRARYPEGFEPERSLHRKEGDI